MKPFFSKILVAAVMATSFAGCSKEEEKCNYEACSFVAPQAEIQAVQNYLAANNITATQHCSGLFYRIENGGTGKQPEACSDVEANYKGMLTNGNVFEQSQTPIEFNLSSVITGWTNGLTQIKEGGRIILYIPPSLAYGNQERRDPQTGALKIPANSILIFEVDLTTVK